MVKKAFKISGEMEVPAEAKQVVLAHGGAAVGYDYGHPVDPKWPKEKFKGKLLKLDVK